MEDRRSYPEVILVLLSSDFRVIGINDVAQRLIGPALGGMGKSLFRYHPRRSHEKIRGLLHSMKSPGACAPATMVLDVLNKVYMINISRLSIAVPAPQTCWSVTFIDVTRRTGAVMNSFSGLLEMKKLPILDKGTYHFLPADTVQCVQSDGDYCKVFTSSRSYYLRMAVQTILHRYTNAGFFRIHKSYVVNLKHVKRIEPAANGRISVILDNKFVPFVPVSRRRLAALKKAIAHQ